MEVRVIEDANLHFAKKHIFDLDGNLINYLFRKLEFFDNHSCITAVQVTGGFFATWQRLK